MYLEEPAGEPAGTPILAPVELDGPGAAYTLNGWYVLNNVWNAGALTYGTDFTVSSAFSPSDLTQHTQFSWSFPGPTQPYPLVRAYPELIFGPSPLGGGHQASDTTTVLPQKVGDISALTASYNMAISGDTSGFDVAFDIWFTSTPNGGASTITNEVMIWVHKGAYDAYGSVVGSYADAQISGPIYHAAAEHYTALVADHDISAGTIDVAGVVHRLEELGIVSPDEFLASIQLGAEVTAGAGSLTVSNLALDVQVAAAGETPWRHLVTGAGVVDAPILATATPTATEAADTLTVSSTVTEIHALGGNDTLLGAGGADYLRGDAGDDSLSGAGGFDDLNGNAGNDTVRGGDSGDWVVGGKDQDLLFGEVGDDVTLGNLGDDTCLGGDGADLIRGGQGDDSLSGGAGNDWLSGDRGNDTVAGGAGADTFHTFSGAGLDRVVDFSAAEGDRVQLDPGTAYTVSQVGADTLVDLGGGDQLILVGVTLSSLPASWIFQA